LKNIHRPYPASRSQEISDRNTNEVYGITPTEYAFKNFLDMQSKKRRAAARRVYDIFLRKRLLQEKQNANG
jgi:hypothetical protein